MELEATEAPFIAPAAACSLIYIGKGNSLSVLLSATAELADSDSYLVLVLPSGITKTFFGSKDGISAKNTTLVPFEEPRSLASSM